LNRLEPIETGVHTVSPPHDGNGAATAWWNGCL